MTDTLMMGRRNFNRGVVKGLGGKAKTVVRILGNEAYYHICRNCCEAKPKQTWRFLAVFGTSSR